MLTVKGVGTAGPPPPQCWNCGCKSIFSPPK